MVYLNPDDYPYDVVSSIVCVCDVSAKSTVFSVCACDVSCTNIVKYADLGVLGPCRIIGAYRQMPTTMYTYGIPIS